MAIIFRMTFVGIVTDAQSENELRNIIILLGDNFFG